MADLDVARAELGLGAPARGGIVTLDQGVYGLLGLRERQRPPRGQCFGQLGIDCGQYVGLQCQKRAGHDHPNGPVGDSAGGEQRRDFGQPLMQADRVVQLRTGCSRCDPLRGGYFGRHRLPGVDAP
jgi:hypothetical protein